MEDHRRSVAVHVGYLLRTRARSFHNDDVRPRPLRADVPPSSLPPKPFCSFVLSIQSPNTLGIWQRRSSLCLHTMLTSLLWKDQMGRSAAHQRGQRSCGAAKSWTLKVLTSCCCMKPIPVCFFPPRFYHALNSQGSRRPTRFAKFVSMVLFLFFVLIDALLSTKPRAWFSKMDT